MTKKTMTTTAIKAIVAIVNGHGQMDYLPL
jgi:hypothetical protein